MNIMSLDLEFSQPEEIIIQVGVAIGDTNTGEILESRSWNIRSDAVVSQYITDLTGITQDDVTNASHTLAECYEELREMHTRHKCMRNPLTWGGGDSEALRHQLGLDEDLFLFGRRHLDTKTLFVSRQMANSLPFVGGLKRSMGRLGMKFEGTPHRAADDARNTFLIYHRLLDHFRVNPPSRP